jgi:hypothetical protein
MEWKSLILCKIVMYDGSDAYVQELCIDAVHTSKGYKPASYVKKRVEKFVSTYGMELLKIDCNTYYTVSIDDIMSWNDKNSDNETVEIKRHFVEMFGDKISYFYSVNDYMN